MFYVTVSSLSTSRLLLILSSGSIGLKFALRRGGGCRLIFSIDHIFHASGVVDSNPIYRYCCYCLLVVFIHHNSDSTAYNERYSIPYEYYL